MRPSPTNSLAPLISGGAPRALTLPWLGLAASTAHLWLIWFSHEHYGYGWIVPFFALYSYGVRWQSRPAPGPPQRVLAAGILAGGMVLFAAGRWLHEAGTDWRPPYLAMTLGGAAMAIAAMFWQGGLRWAWHFAFPALFPLAAVPWPMGLEMDLAQGLSRTNATVAAEALIWSGLPASRVGNVLLTPGGPVGIEDACSGIRSMQAVLMLGLLFGEFFRLTVLRRILLAISGVALALLLNLARTLVLVGMTAQMGPDGLERWHDPVAQGFFALSCVAIWLAGLAVRGRTVCARPHDSGNLTSAPTATLLPRWLFPLTLAAVLAAELFPFAWYGRRSSDGERAAVGLRVSPPEHLAKAEEIPLGRLVQRTLQADRSLAMSWQRDHVPWLAYHFVWEPGNLHALPARSHTPEVCLTGRSGMRLIRRHSPVTVQTGSLEVHFDFYTFDNVGVPWQVFFASWQEARGGAAGPAIREVPTGWERFQAALAGRRVQGLATLELATPGFTDPVAAEQAFKTEIAGWITEVTVRSATGVPGDP